MSSDMAFRVLRVFGVISNSLKTSVLLRNESIRYPQTSDLLNLHTPLTMVKRNTGFFTRQSADELWKGTLSVSNAGRKRGRARGLRKRINLYKGQTFGVGKMKITFPGLNSPVMQGKEIKQHIHSKDLPKEEKVTLMEQATSEKFRYPKQSPMERGWTGGQPGGRKIGPPVAEDSSEDFKDFESWILDCKMVMTQSGVYGRVRTIRTFAVTGNGNGLVGVAVAKASTQTSSVHMAKNRAGKRLMYIPRYEEHTVLHDFVGQFGRAKVIVEKVPKGYGLVCHRAIKVCCEAIGIKDIYAKVEGPKNVRTIIKAFLIGLLQQKSYQEMADEKKLHVVELREEHMNYPRVLASPAVVRKADEISPEEIIDFKQYLLDGRVLLAKKKYVPFYTKLPTYELYLKKQERSRNHNDVRLRLLAEYGELRSFLTDKYPEARFSSEPKKEE